MPHPRDTIGVRVARFVRKAGRAWARAGVIVAATAGLGGALAGACFHPREVPCAFSCVSSGARCPTDFTCGMDGLCHRDGAEPGCTLTAPDVGAGGTSGASSDAGAIVPDASTDGDASDGAPDVITP